MRFDRGGPFAAGDDQTQHAVARTPPPRRCARSDWEINIDAQRSAPPSREGGTLRCALRLRDDVYFPACAFAAFTTASNVKPKCGNKSFSGADAPNDRIPMIAPVRPA